MIGARLRLACPLGNNVVDLAEENAAAATADVDDIVADTGGCTLTLCNIPPDRAMLDGRLGGLAALNWVAATAVASAAAWPAEATLLLLSSVRARFF